MLRAKDTFSATGRQRVLEDMAGERFDLLIIGGGITGAGIALDAASRGLRTALVEMQDFAAGTSSRSTKLIHGGLRYLKQFAFGLVAESGRERAVVHENGPHVTVPKRMLLPFYAGGTLGPLTANVGLTLYDVLAGVKRSERRRMLSARETLEKEPLLKRDGLRGGGDYVEYRTDDARLTLEVLKKAVTLGAMAVNYAEAEGFIVENGQLIGVVVRDRIGGDRYEIRAGQIVNAAGPWADKVRGFEGDTPDKTLRLTKGVHLVFDGARFPLRQAVYFDVPDGRMVFAIPRQGKTYVGTTDTDYDGDPARPRMSAADLAYLLQAANDMFPSLNLTVQDVVSSWAGLRVLRAEEGKDPSAVSRREEMAVSANGLITIAGGKLTGYRKMAEKVVDTVAKRIKQGEGRTVPVSRTRQLTISGGDVGGSTGWEAFVKAYIDSGVSAGLSVEEAERIVRRYGSNAPRLFGIAGDNRARAERHGLPVGLLAELLYAVEEEMCVTTVDFWLRRTGMLLFDRPGVLRWKDAVSAVLVEQLGCSDAQKEAHDRELERELEAAVKPSVS